MIVIHCNEAFLAKYSEHDLQIRAFAEECLFDALDQRLTKSAAIDEWIERNRRRFPEYSDFIGSYTALADRFVQAAAGNEGGIDETFLHRLDGAVVRTGVGNALEVTFQWNTGQSGKVVAGEKCSRGAGRVDQADAAVTQAGDAAETPVAANDEQLTVEFSRVGMGADAPGEGGESRDAGIARIRLDKGRRSQFGKVDISGEQALNHRPVGRGVNDLDPPFQSLFQHLDERLILGQLKFGIFLGDQGKAQGLRVLAIRCTGRCRMQQHDEDNNKDSGQGIHWAGTRVA